MASTFHTESAEGPLLLADIGGYTEFLQAVAEAHRDDAFADGAVPEAYRLMSSLLDGIVGRIVPPFALSKLEGDAVFAFAAAGPDVPRGGAVLDCIRACYADFRLRLNDVGKIWACNCMACARATSLDLKFVLHAGRYVLQQIAGSRELSGPDVVMAHRLLKNGAAAWSATARTRWSVQRRSASSTFRLRVPSRRRRATRTTRRSPPSRSPCGDGHELAACPGNSPGRSVPKTVTGRSRSPRRPPARKFETGRVRLANRRVGAEDRIAMRMSMRRFTRLTNGFSKKVENHAAW